MKNKLQLVSGLLGLSGVALGALGAHALHARLGPSGLEIWRTAVLYHLVHAVAAFAAAGAAAPAARWPARAAWCWTAGVVLFSGSLYALALGGPHWLGPVTPLGGLALLAGWICACAQGWPRRSAPAA